ncbi:MAG: hypothetical protein IJJ26_09735 [Victivallales bacterium]|nr:hypothetical protein [Victivallales bacterium]
MASAFGILVVLRTHCVVSVLAIDIPHSPDFPQKLWGSNWKPRQEKLD